MTSNTLVITVCGGVVFSIVSNFDTKDITIILQDWDNESTEEVLSSYHPEHVELTACQIV